MKTLGKILSRCLALVLVAVIGLVGCSSPTGLTGNFTEDTLSVVEKLETTINLAVDDPGRPAAQEAARADMNDYISRYRRNSKYSGTRSFTTMQTALNALAGYYSAFGSRPLTDKLKTRLNQEFDQVKLAAKRGL